MLGRDRRKKHSRTIFNPHIVNWSPMLAAATSARQKPLHAYFNVLTPALVTEHLELLDHLCGTASPPNSASLISLWDSSAER